MYDEYGLDFILHGGAEPQPGPGGAGPNGMPFGGGGPHGGFAGMGGMPGGGRAFHFSTDNGSGRGFNFSHPDSIFAEFFRQSGGGMGGEEDPFVNFANPRRPSGGGRSFREGNGPSQRSRRTLTPEVTTVEKPLPVSLEDLFKGVHKKMRIKRKTFDSENGKRIMEEKVLDIDIKPGYKAGTKIKFKGVGDQEEEGGTQDLHFVVAEVSSFSRREPTSATQVEHATNTFGRVERASDFQA